MDIPDNQLGQEEGLKGRRGLKEGLKGKPGSYQMILGTGASSPHHCIWVVP